MNATDKFRDRIIRVVKVKASSLRVHPRNWRTHPEYQTGALTAVLERIGFVGAVLVREAGPPGDDTQLEVLDGHLRRDLLGEQEVTALVTDLSPEEGLEVLATHDQITSLAVADPDTLKGLLTDLKGMKVPLLDMGWPEFKLDTVLGEKFIPAPAAGGGGGGGGAGGPPPANNVAEHYRGMPEFHQDDLTGVRTITMHFDTHADVAEFGRRLGLRLSEKTRSAWFPHKEQIDGRSYTAGSEESGAEAAAGGAAQ